MPRTRAPQNSASSCHQRLFSDLQAVYQKIIQTNGASFPFRAKESRRPLHTAPANRSRQALTMSNSVFASRTPSARSSVEEIIIKPLHFHDRLTYTSCSSRCHPVSISSSETDSQIRSPVDSDSDFLGYKESTMVRVRSRSSLAAPVEYSEQSIRYVTEQVSLEQARQLKLRSNTKQHRVDRRYFVCGSKMHIQKQAFEETHGESLKLNCENRTNTIKLRHSCRARLPLMRGKNRNNSTVGNKAVQEGVCGTSLKHQNFEKDENAAVAIPTATDNSKSQPTNLGATVNEGSLEETSLENDNGMTPDSPA